MEGDDNGVVGQAVVDGGGLAFTEASCIVACDLVRLCKRCVTAGASAAGR